MKICLYLEFYHFWGGRLFKGIGTGLLSSYRNQRAMLKGLGLDFVEAWQDDCDILQLNTPWLKSLWLARRARRQGKKVIFWAHVTAEDAKAVFRFMPLVLPLFRRYLAYAYGRADLIFCPSAYTKSLLLAYGLPEAKLAVQSNGVDLAGFYPDPARRQAARQKSGLDRFTVGSVGLVIPRKGTDTFLKLAAAEPSWRFVWYGKIYSRWLVKPLPADLPANAIFTGYVNDILAAYNSLDVFIFPSYEENQGMAILEAAAVGLPILVRDLPVYQGWLVHDQNCLKASSDDDFLANLRRLEAEPALRLELGANALKLAQAESRANLSKNLLATYQRLLGRA